MKLQEEDAERDAWDSALAAVRLSPLASVAGFASKTMALADIEVRKLRNDYTELLTRAAQPVLWFVLFGEVMTRARAFPTGAIAYRDFLAPGILAQSVLFVSIFYGISVIWERDLGIINKYLVSPTPRAALVLGKALSAGVRAFSQALIIFALAQVLGVKLNWHPLALLGVVAVVFLGAALFSTFSLIIACIVKTRERFMGIGQVLTMPLFFASNAIYPIELMPGWLRLVSTINPLSYEVDALRTLMLSDWPSGFGVGMDFAVLLSVTVMLIMIGARLYPRVVI